MSVARPAGAREWKNLRLGFAGLWAQGNATGFEKAIPVLLKVSGVEAIAAGYQAGDIALPPGCQSGDEERKKEGNGMEQYGMEGALTRERSGGRICQILEC